MLMVPFRVTKAVKGLDSDKGAEDGQLKAWFKPNRGTGKRKLSDTQHEPERNARVLAQRGNNSAQRILEMILAPDEPRARPSDTQIYDSQAHHNMEVR